MPKILDDTIDPQERELGKRLQQLAKDNPAQLAEFIMELTDEEADEILHNDNLWLRDSQIIDLASDIPIHLMLMGRGDLALSTPILTANKGWVTMGDIVVGDIVYAWDGSETPVIDTHRPEERKLIELTFSDGEKIVASEQHDWFTLTRKQRAIISKHYGNKIPEDWLDWEHDNGKEVVRSERINTKKLVDTFREWKQLNHSIPLCRPLQGKHDPRITDPYYLGYWLGDGLSGAAHRVACGQEDLWWMMEHWPDFAETSSPSVYRREIEPCKFIYDFKLRNNKHIPKEVFKASVEQRMLVVQGMMDSDGYARKSQNGVEFCTVKKHIAEEFIELVRGLGEKPTLIEGDATIEGRFISRKYRVCWRPATFNPFRIPRKVERLDMDNVGVRNQQRMIKSWRYVDYEPTQCIEIAHDSHVFLAGKSLIPTGNSGKSHAAAATLKRLVEVHGVTEVLMLAQSARDFRSTLVPAIIGKYPEKHPNRPIWSPAKSQIIFPRTGTTVHCISSDAGADAPRGLSVEVLIADEIVTYDDMEILDQALMTLRLEPSIAIFLTTPKPNEWLIDAVERSKRGDGVKLYTGSTYDNLHNLSRAFKDSIIKKYEGTSLGNQELNGELIIQSESALWKPQIVDGATIHKEALPILESIAIGVDPAVLSKSAQTKKGRTPDATGIIVSARGTDGNLYTLEGATGSYTMEGWALRVADIFDNYSDAYPTKIVIETNVLGMDAISMAFKQAGRPDLVKHIEPVFATLSKMARAMPYALATERGEVKFVRGAYLQDLKTELITWDGKGKKSPNNLDAFVWSLSYLKPVRKSVTKSFELMV